MENIKLGVRGEDDHSILEGNSKSLLQLDYDDMTLDGGDDGNDGLNLISSKKGLYEYSEKGGEGNLAEYYPSTPLAGKDQGKEQAVMHEEIVTVEDVLEGDEDADDSAGVGHSASAEKATTVTDKQ